MFLSVMVSFLLVILVYFLFCIIFFKKMYSMESGSSYECGFDPKSNTRIAFSYRFFLISILFLIFDVEIALMLPIPYLTGMVQSLWGFLVFVLVLFMGLLYEYYCGSLEWLNNFVSKA